MKISPCNSLSFTSIPLYDVKLKKKNSDGSFEEIPATFSKLDNSDKSDISEAEHIYTHWFSGGFGLAAARHFLFSAEADEPGRYDYYVVENTDSVTGLRNIYSIAEYNRTDRTVELLQSNPENKNNGVKGSGEMMLYGIAKYNRPKFSKINFDLLSTEQAKEFYRNIGLDGFYLAYQLDTDKTDEFLNRIEEKYHLNVEI